MGILITGATGSFGQAFVKRLLSENKYERICIYSRDEAKQAVMREKFDNDDRLRFFIGCVRDQSRLYRAMEDIDVVVHAAALKRIETCFYNPGEMVKTNVMGSMNVIEAAHDAGVKKVVALSTDKAYQPVSAYGHSKALAESLFLAANYARGKCGPIFAVTRYGNVAGSNGSVIPKWKAIKEANASNVHDFKKLPITDEDCTRFYMTLDESVNLVMDTVTNMQGGELNIPELPAYRLGDLAEAIGIKTEITGLPNFEKKHESMETGKSSETARRMSVEEIREAIKML